jgi:hypothetical protein
MQQRVGPSTANWNRFEGWNDPIEAADIDQVVSGWSNARGRGREEEMEYPNLG